MFKINTPGTTCISIYSKDLNPFFIQPSCIELNLFVQNAFYIIFYVLTIKHFKSCNIIFFEHFFLEVEEGGGQYSRLNYRTFITEILGGEKCIFNL